MSQKNHGTLFDKRDSVVESKEDATENIEY